MDPNLPFLLEDLVLSAIAQKHKQTPALVALRYQMQRGVVVLAKSYNKKRIKENMQVMMSGAVGRGLLRDNLHEDHSLSSLNRHNFPVPSSYLHPSKMSSSLQGEAGSLGAEINMILPFFLVFDFDLTPEDLEAIDGINRNIRYYEYLM